MFRIRNVLPGILTVDLERGSINLRSGQSFDIEDDGGCSRKWIKNDPTLNRFLQQGILKLVHDSGKPRILKASGRGAPKKPVHFVPTFSTPPHPSVPPKVDESPIVETFESPTVEVLSVEEPPELDHMTKKQMVAWAEEHGLEVDLKMRKRLIRETIEESDVYQVLVK